MTDVKRQKRYGIILSYFALIINTLISLLYTPLMLRSLGQSEYGVYQLVFSATNYLTLLNLGLSGSYNRFFAKLNANNDQNGINKLNAMFISTFGVITLIAIAIGIVLSLNIDILFQKSLTVNELQVGRTLAILMTLNVGVTLLTTPFTSAINANEYFIFYRLVIICTYVLHGIGCVTVLLVGGKSIALTAVSLGLSIFSISIQFLFCKRILGYSVSFLNIKREEFRELFSFSLFILLYDIINQLNWGIDKIILGMEVGTAGVAVYGVASQLNTYYMKISTTISTVFIPQVNRMVASIKDTDKRDNELSLLMIRIGRIQFIVVGLVISGFVVFGRQFISLWAGNDYQVSYYIGLWLMLPITVDLIQNIGTQISRAEDMHRPITICFLFVALTNAALTIPFCKRFGPVGCAMATAITVIGGHGFYLNWYYRKRLKLYILEFWKEIVKIVPSIIPAILFGIAVSRLFSLNTYLKLVLAILAYSVIYFASVYLISLNNNEKLYVHKLCARFWHR